ncbi:glycosyltransferase [Patescibacteria group bacterium]|nr:glycosyltransferase [Patescibacteria group bacterium]
MISKIPKMKKKNKHLVFITNSEIAGGAEICLKNLIVELKKNPLEFELIYPEKKEIKNLFKQLESKKHKLSLGHSSIKFRGLNLYSPSIFIHYLRLKKVIQKINQNNKIDLIYTQQDPKEKFLSSLIGRQLNIPVVWMEHSKLHPWQKLFHFKCLYQYFAKKTAKIIAVSQAVKKSLVAIGVSAKKIKVIWNGVRIKELKDKKITQWEKKFKLKNKIVFGSCSRLAYKKGVHELIKVTHQVHRKNKKIMLLIIGSGKEEKNLKAQVKKFKAQNYIKFLGFQKNAAALNALFDVVVSPSFDEGEGLPLRIIEGMALGKPIISTDISGSKEEVRDGANGYLIKTHNIKALKKKMIKLAEKPILRKKMGQESFKLYQRFFTVDRMSNSIYKIIIKTIKESKI